MKISQIIKENEKRIIELAERKVIEFADNINRGSEERAFLRKVIIDVAFSSQTNLIEGLIEKVEGMKDMFACALVVPESEIPNQIIFNKGGLEALQKVIDLLKKR